MFIRRRGACGANGSAGRMQVQAATSRAADLPDHSPDAIPVFSLKQHPGEAGSDAPSANRFWTAGVGMLDLGCHMKTSRANRFNFNEPAVPDHKKLFYAPLDRIAQERRLQSHQSFYAKCGRTRKLDGPADLFRSSAKRKVMAAASSFFTALLGKSYEFSQPNPGIIPSRPRKNDLRVRVYVGILNPLAAHQYR